MAASIKAAWPGQQHAPPTDKQPQVFICTAALFLSGYALQQRTLRDLRAAIKAPPRPSPKIFLPDRFRQETTELPDGRIVVLDSGAIASQQHAPVIEVRPTLPDEQQTAPNDTPGAATQPTKTETDKPKGAPENGDRASEQEGQEEPQKPMSRAERRWRIKAEIQRTSQGEERGYYQRRLW